MSKTIDITHPKLIKEWDFAKNINIDYKKLTFGSNTKVFWICKNNHSWTTLIKYRTRKKYPEKCSECNSVAFKFPKLVKEFDKIKNKNLDLNLISYGSDKKVWWKCTKCKYNYKAIIQNRTLRKSNCPACDGKIITSKNRLSVTFSNLVKEWHPTKNGKLTPNKVSYGQDRKVWWLCKKCKYSFFQAINKRTSKQKEGCPACSGRIVSNLNRLSIKFPKLSKEWHPKKNRKLTPADISIGSHKKVWWICEKKHNWKAAIHQRVKGSGCPYCNPATSKLEIRIYSEIKKLIPTTVWRQRIKKQEIDVFIKELNLGIEIDGSFWHKNKYLKDLNKNKVLSKEKIYLIRLREDPLKLISKNDLPTSSKESHSQVIQKLFKKIIRFSNNKKLNTKIRNYLFKNKYINNKEYLRIISYLPGPTPENSLLYQYPKLSQQWHYRLNYPLKPDMFFKKSATKVWWICNKSKIHTWKTNIYNRTNGTGCPYCDGKKVSIDNSFAYRFPDLLKDFDYEKNKEINPLNFTAGSNKKVWWKCKNCKHSWKTTFTVRSRHGCYPCSKKNRKVVVEDKKKLSVLYPNLIKKEWNYNKNIKKPNEYSFGSGQKVWWKCKKNHVWKTAIYNRTMKKTSCPKCSKVKNQFS